MSNPDAYPIAVEEGWRYCPACNLTWKTAAKAAAGLSIDVASGLTDDELRALDLTADLVNLVNQNVISDGPNGRSDFSEFVGHIHNIQRMIMAQAAARAYPYRFRLLGGVVEAPAQSEQ